MTVLKARGLFWETTSVENEPQTGVGETILVDEIQAVCPDWAFACLP